MLTHSEFQRGALAGVSLGTPTTFVWGLIDAASIGVSAYHGYKRHGGSIPWALGWGFLGGLFPIVTPAIAFAQGIGKRK